MSASGDVNEDARVGVLCGVVFVDRWFWFVIWCGFNAGIRMAF